MLIFVSGGVRSGKSRVAEEFISTLYKEHAVYIATSRLTDHEMKQRIQLHQNQRRASLVPWETYEVPIHLKSIFSSIRPTDVLLLDCVTNWLANELFSNEQRWQTIDKQREVYNEMIEVIETLQNKCKAIVLVSNELFEASTLEGPTYTYMYMLGKLHQFIIEKADIAVCVEAGIPLYKKGKEAFLYD
ncbi:cobinamide phosphate guanylyltransferase [Priestia megaterium]|nr:cobinamide phosphate guanylyltransferase [Priestia megaterium]